MKLYDGVRVVPANITHIFDCFMHDDEYVYEQLVHLNANILVVFKLVKFSLSENAGAIIEYICKIREYKRCKWYENSQWQKNIQRTETPIASCVSHRLFFMFGCNLFFLRKHMLIIQSHFFRHNSILWKKRKSCFAIMYGYYSMEKITIVPSPIWFFFPTTAHQTNLDY